MSLAKIHKAFSITLILLGLGFLFFNWFNSVNHPRQWQIYLNKSLGTSDVFRIFDEITFDEKSLYFNSENHHTYSVDQKSGQINWRFSGQDHSPFPPTLTGHFVIISSFDGHIYGLNKKTGEELWHYKIPDSTLPDTPVLLSTDEKILYFASRKGKLIALETESGGEIWQKSFVAIDNSKAQQQAPIHFGTIWSKDGKIFVVHAPTSTLTALDQTTGQELWKVDSFQFTHEKPIYKDNYIIFKQDNLVSSINIETAKINQLNFSQTKSWEINIRDLGPEANSLVISDKKNQITFTPSLQESRTEAEAVLINLNWNSEPQPVIFKQNYFIQTNSSSLTKLNTETNEIAGELTFPFSPFISGVIDQNKLILGNSLGHIVAIDTNTWETIFESKLDHKVIKIIATPKGYVVITQKPNAYINFSLINFEGKIIWNYSPSNAVNQENIYYWDNQLYFTNKDESVLESLEVSSKKPSNLNKKKINFDYQSAEYDQNPYLEIIPTKNEPKQLKKTTKLKILVKNFFELHKFQILHDAEENVHQIKISHLDKFYSQPQLEVKVKAEITHLETKEKIQLSGYYSDRNKWQINFLPKNIGNYQANILIKTPYSINFQQKTFSVESTNYNPLAIKDKSFVDKNNKIFIPLGIEDTFFDLDFDGDYQNQMQPSNLEKPTEIESQFQFYSWQKHTETFFPESRINIYRYGVDNWTPNLFYKITEGQFKPSINGGAFGDNLVKTIKNKDIRIMMTVFGFFPPHDSEHEINQSLNQHSIEKYLDYIVARYSAYVDLWEIGNEANSDAAFYKEVVPYLKKIDPYQHPITTNWEEPSNELFEYVSIHHYENPEISAVNIANSLDNIKYSNTNKPIIISEFGLKNASWFNGSLTQLRITTWVSAFQQMGMIAWNQGQNGIYHNLEYANIYLGPKERSILRNLRNFLPELAFPTKSSQFIVENTELRAYTLANEDHYLVYFLNLDTTPQQGYFRLPIPAKKEVMLIDPATESVINTFVTKEDKENFLLPPITQDLAIRVNLN